MEEKGTSTDTKHLAEELYEYLAESKSRSDVITHFEDKLVAQQALGLQGAIELIERRNEKMQNPIASSLVDKLHKLRDDILNRKFDFKQ